MTPGPAGSTGDITGGCGSPCPSPMGVQIAGVGGGGVAYAMGGALSSGPDSYRRR